MTIFKFKDNQQVILLREYLEDNYGIFEKNHTTNDKQIVINPFLCGHGPGWKIEYSISKDFELSYVLTSTLSKKDELVMMLRFDFSEVKVYT